MEGKVFQAGGRDETEDEVFWELRKKRGDVMGMVGWLWEEIGK